MNEVDTDKQVTEWLYPNHVFESQYGEITAIEWCRREANRLGGEMRFKGKNVAVFLI